MSRFVTSLPVAVVVCVAGFVAPAFAQRANSAQPVDGAFQPVSLMAAAHGELQGVVTDDRGEPLAGAVVSALGATTAFAVTDRAGRFSFRTLPAGPYLVRAHLQGYVPARAQIVQIHGAARATSLLSLARRASPDAPAEILAAGVADVAQPQSSAAGESHDHGETAWRLRHLKRSVLREAETGVLTADDDHSFLVDSLEAIGRAMGYSARLASAMFDDVSLSGEVNLLTTRSFDSPQDLFSTNGGAPRGVAFVSLDAPTSAGDWNIRGAMTQGDLASWIVAGSYLRRPGTAHQYEAGMSYSMQRYEGGNLAALAAVADGSRNAGTVYAYDTWRVVPGLTVNYGARYAQYDYLEDDGQFSPRMSVTVSPTPPLRLRATVQHRETAPGAEEFNPREALGVWLPPERTFSPLSARRGFRPERLDHYEVAAEHDMGGGIVMGVRTFRQRIEDQIVTLFGVALPGEAVADVGHYYVASAGDVDAHGWGISVSRPLAGHVRGSIDYTRTDAEWTRMSPDWRVLSVVARSALRTEAETVHDLTASVQTDVPVTATRVFLLYKINSGFAAPDAETRTGGIGKRFDVQVNQALPFLNFTSAQWEMLFTVRNLFRDDLLGTSTYDELLVVKPPKRVVGGLTVRF